MFIFCKVKEDGEKCLLQNWAFKIPFSQIFVCPVHGLVDADGNRYCGIHIQKRLA